jgi:hypothetical protein
LEAFPQRPSPARNTLGKSRRWNRIDERARHFRISFCELRRQAPRYSPAFLAQHSNRVDVSSGGRYAWLPAATSRFMFLLFEKRE